MILEKKISLVIMIYFVTFSLFSEEENEVPNWGFIFNTSNLFLDIESYQAGIGTKVLFQNDIALRFLLDGFYSSSTNTFSSGLGIAFEKHLRRKRVSPYIGGFFEVGIMSQKLETDADNWTKNLFYPLSVGAILGVEFFIVESVSLFAEYNLVFEGMISTSSNSVAGTITKTDPQFSYTIDTGIGNESKLGVIIYLKDVIKIDK